LLSFKTFEKLAKEKTPYFFRQVPNGKYYDENIALNSRILVSEIRSILKN